MNEEYTIVALPLIVSFVNFIHIRALWLLMQYTRQFLFFSLLVRFHFIISSSASIFIKQQVFCYYNLLEAKKKTTKNKESTSSSFSLCFVCSSHFFLHSVEREREREKETRNVLAYVTCTQLMIVRRFFSFLSFDVVDIEKCVETYACTNAFVAFCPLTR